MIKKRRTLKSFVQRSSDKLQHNEQEMDRLIQRMVNERALERDAVPQTGEADGPQAPNSATDGPGLSQRLSISSNHSQSTMSGTVTMEDDHKVQAQYTPIDYPRFKMTLIDCLGDTDIDKIVECLNIPDGLMSGGSNKGDGAKLKMVKLLEQKGHISKDSIDGLITALQDLPFESTANTIPKLFQDLRGSQKGFGPFKVKLADLFTNDIMYGLATVLKFKPAEVDDLNLIPDRKGMKFVFILEQRNIISEEDASELIKTLDAIGNYDNLLKKLKEMTNATDHIDLK